MLTKILGFLLVYVLSIVNFLVVLSPIAFVFAGKYLLKVSMQMRYIESLMFFSIAGVSFLMLLFLFFDFCFSSSVVYYMRRSILASEDEKYKKLSEIFEVIQKKFTMTNVKLCIIKTNEVNAYAVGSLRKNVVVMTTGLIGHYKNEVEDSEKLLLSLEGILAHEISHIANRDYFTALLLIINERATHFISKIIWLLFSMFINLINIVPVIGYYIATAITAVYNALNFIMEFFYKYVMLNIYKFIQLQISKSIEYRADEQAAMVIGGQNMAYALSLLGNSGYFSIFSTHPTTKQRIRSVEKIKIKEGSIKSVFGSNLAIILSFMFMASILGYSYRLANIDALLRDYDNMESFVVNKYIAIKTTLMILVNKYFDL
jgi:Zn-dependent protease with chaperone function